MATHRRAVVISANSALVLSFAIAPYISVVLVIACTRDIAISAVRRMMNAAIVIRIEVTGCIFIAVWAWPSSGRTALTRVSGHMTDKKASTILPRSYAENPLNSRSQKLNGFPGRIHLTEIDHLKPLRQNIIKVALPLSFLRRRESILHYMDSDIQL